LVDCLIELTGVTVRHTADCHAILHLRYHRHAGQSLHTELPIYA